MTMVPILVASVYHWYQDQPGYAPTAWDAMANQVLTYFGVLFLVALAQMSWQVIQEAVPEEQQLEVAARFVRQVFFALHREVLPL